MPPISLRELLGTLVGEVVRSEYYAARATLDFLRLVGFEGSRSGLDWGDVRFIQFSYDAALPDGGRQARKLRVPLLTLLPIPTQHVAAAEYDFFLHVTDLRPGPDSDADLKRRPTFATATGTPAGIWGEVGPYTTEQAESPPVPRIRIRLSLRQSDLPSGVATTLRQLDALIAKAP